MALPKKLQNTKKTINPYLTFLLGKGFKNMMICVLTLTLISIVIIVIVRKWVDKEMTLNIAYLIFGALLGKWLSNGKK